MARLRRGSFPARGPRRLNSWDDGTGGVPAQTITGSTVAFVGNAVSVLTDGTTLVRTRGQLDVILAAASAAGDGYQGAFGIGVTTQAAVAVGITAVPTPITEQTWDGWLYWTPISVHVGEATAGDKNWASGAQRTTVDSKAMRKLKEDQSIFAVWEVTEIGTATATIFWDSRALFKLP